MSFLMIIVIASINCGASDVVTDLNLITWNPDDTLVSNGDARKVPSINSVSKVLDTLRVFTRRKKNCYSIPVTKGDKVLVRASFYYGNYDGLSNPPEFNLHFDGNFWETVETTMTDVIRYEITYVSKHDFVSVCVAQTRPGQFPFISSLEVRKLDSDMYREVDESRALILLRRVSFGASQGLRYPNDMYDRIWKYPADIVSRVKNSASPVDTTKTPNKPPSGIFDNAMTGVGTTVGLFLGTVNPLDTPIYANMYFSEVTSLGTILKRSFRVYGKNSTAPSDWLPSSTPISPPYGSVIVQSFYNYSVNSMTDIYLGAYDNSDLPPIINAMEVFQISAVLTDGTNTIDVKALSLLQSTFDVLGGWSGDPCLPAPYSWDWLNCSNDATPRVTSLNLASFDLSGSLPDISSMDALLIIDLHNNSLSGAIPSFLGTMPNLQRLNLADNQFSGPLPTSLSTNKKLNLNVNGNPSLCTSGNSCSSTRGKKKSSILPIILGIAIPVFVLFWVAAGVFIVLRKKKRAANINMPATVVTRENGNPYIVQRTSEGLENENAGSPVPQVVVSPQHVA
ncbi:malectin-like carbohydrate-binding domain-containing protein [Artemisia annua]|uniref:Malectin-like carbohydrate-binding domain-containing protein n=1 Tax=Artemisia annua TaxID=35608 RepID=A0A2U1LVT9_ARTAN|nr:malectin-like carbohydrate-binding domain-containing protein [Artemisia annua]